MLGKLKLDATTQRWVASLADYDFTITYRSGKTNVDADILSRISHSVDCHVVKAVCTSAVVSDNPSVESIFLAKDAESLDTFHL